MRKVTFYVIPIVLLLGCTIASSAELPRREIAYKAGDSGKYVFYQADKEVGTLAFTVSEAPGGCIKISQKLKVEMTVDGDALSLDTSAEFVCDSRANPKTHVMSRPREDAREVIKTDFSNGEAMAAVDFYDTRAETLVKTPKDVFAGTPYHVPEWSAAFQSLDLSGREPIEIDVYLTDSKRLAKMTLTPRGEETISLGGNELSTIAVYVMPIDETVYVDKKTGEILRVVMHKTGLTIELVKGD